MFNNQTRANWVRRCAESWRAAHNIMFHEIPKIVTKGLALTITDESWWQIGLEWTGKP